MSARLTGTQVHQIYRLRADGHTHQHIAEVVGCSRTTVRRVVPGTVGKVAVAALRDAFLASGRSATQVARSAGWFCTNSQLREYPDGSRVKRTLGLLPDTSGTRKLRSWRKVADAEIVAVLAEAIGVSPWEVLPDDEGMAA